MINIENVPKLITKEDPYNIHKTIGILSLLHFGYRYYKLYFKDMDFNTDKDIFCLLLHFLLSASSFQFKIPQTRNRASPMIYPEFRMHNFLFSFRSILCTIFFYYKFPIYYNILTCFLTMGFADIVTYCYKDGTTMRDIKFDLDVPEDKRKAITSFHSKMQIAATFFMVGNTNSAFSPLFAIQFSSFLMTLVRKNIIKRNEWHLLYGLSLMINIFIYRTLSFDYIFFQQSTLVFFMVFRFKKNYNKYLCWSIVFLAFLIYKQYSYDIFNYDNIYLNTIKIILFSKYFFDYLPMFVIPYNNLPKYFL